MRAEAANVQLTWFKISTRSAFGLAEILGSMNRCTALMDAYNTFDITQRMAITVYQENGISSINYLDNVEEKLFHSKVME